MGKFFGCISLVLAIFLAATPAFAQSAPDATAELRDAQGNVVGTADLTPVANGVQIQLQVNGFASAVSGGERGEHGFHIHQVGECTAPDFSSAGGHFNPTGTDHGLLDPDGPHAGDLPNLWIEADGSADYSVTTNLISLGSDERSVFDNDGNAVIIHSGPDDYITNPSGDSGSRLACGVLTPAQ